MAWADEIDLSKLGKFSAQVLKDVVLNRLNFDVWQKKNGHLILRNYCQKRGGASA